MRLVEAAEANPAKRGSYRKKAALIGNPVVMGGIPLPSDAPLFLAFIGLHLAAGMICVIAGVIAMLSRKQHGPTRTPGRSIIARSRSCSSL